MIAILAASGCSKRPLRAWQLPQRVALCFKIDAPIWGGPRGAWRDSLAFNQASQKGGSGRSSLTEGWVGQTQALSVSGMNVRCTCQQAWLNERSPPPPPGNLGSLWRYCGYNHWVGHPEERAA